LQARVPRIASGGPIESVKKRVGPDPAAPLPTLKQGPLAGAELSDEGHRLGPAESAIESEETLRPDQGTSGDL
jgi:hypothetical protein